MMNDEPTFPADAFGKGPETMPPPAAPAAESSAIVSTDDEQVASSGGEAPAEVVSTVEAIKSKVWPAAGVAIGIGSAAIAAALLYRSRR